LAAIGHVFTITYVAAMLGEDEDWIRELSIDMFAEKGRVYLYSGNDEAVTAPTEFGIKCLRQTIANARASGRVTPRRTTTE
jgi:hypothetical protein